jgi:SAM-dependent methyltransferase
MYRQPLDPALVLWSFDIYTWFAELQPSQRILDIGSGPGSFPWTGCGSIVTLDEDVNTFRTVTERGPGARHPVVGRSDRLPFGRFTFDLIVCHHSLEHLNELGASLHEITRVLKPDGRLYIAVPNGYGLCDAVYRFVFAGGGHVNRFAKDQLVTLVETTVGVHMVRWQKLYSSFVYLRKLIYSRSAPPPNFSARLRALGRFPRAIAATQWLLYLGTRAADRIFRTDLAVYGWAFYFDRSNNPPLEDPAYPNVCLYCGSGHHALSVERPSRLSYRCNVCNHINPFVAPFRNTR